MLLKNALEVKKIRAIHPGSEAAAELSIILSRASWIIALFFKLPPLFEYINLPA